MCEQRAVGDLAETPQAGVFCERRQLGDSPGAEVVGVITVVCSTAHVVLADPQPAGQGHLSAVLKAGALLDQHSKHRCSI